MRWQSQTWRSSPADAAGEGELPFTGVLRGSAAGVGAAGGTAGVAVPAAGGGFGAAAGAHGPPAVVREPFEGWACDPTGGLEFGASGWAVRPFTRYSSKVRSSWFNSSRRSISARSD